MTTTTPESEGGPREPSAPSSSPSAPDRHATMLVGASTSRCTECGAELAIDQRYCVECGTRRGRPRFTIARPAAESAAAAGATPPQPRQSRLIGLLVVIVVLLAVGVGVLIANGSNSIRQPVAVTITGGSLGGRTSTTGAAGSGTATNAGSKPGSGSKSGSTSGPKSGGSSSTQNQNFFGG